MRSFTILSVIFSLVLLASVAWSSPNMFDDILKRADAITDTASTASNTQTQTASGTNTASDTATISTGTAAPVTSTGTNTKTTGTGTNAKTTGTGTNTNVTSTTHSTTISVDPRLPAGGASMTNPASTTTTYYKIGQNVTFGWNFTSVLVTPSAVNVIASCRSNSATYTLASNVSYSNATSVVWETDNYGADSQSPLLTAHYTLIIYEAGTSPTDIPSAGKLGAASYTFAMYSTQAYTPLSSYVCVTCNSAVSTMDRQALTFILGMVAITIFSFTSFAGGFGLF
ncbi:hypothetical protein TMatcc_007996 [Talaromyces marneffei ATCC 18224]|uniref:DUF7137 domain-containing protein n=2 Tax=Talaromyces marneffei TaxID=37727 RepID=B6QE51_TALMQ|nr:uncharacterized protein EYB26_004903 [Talaromyces marneffei]EEA24896.1 conserved hypothetical protein [Talaromyces marneffei ATCC 18224]KAE8552631.1 hypothetical protein EYB25_004010 [Talaromyces marneffei]QGA17233.1 hypothetical protein EYB26_004903 [Talaromyces marneffei]